MNLKSVKPSNSLQKTTETIEEFEKADKKKSRDLAYLESSLRLLQLCYFIPNNIHLLKKSGIQLLLQGANLDTEFTGTILENDT